MNVTFHYSYRGYVKVDGSPNFLHAHASVELLLLINEGKLSFENISVTRKLNLLLHNIYYIYISFFTAYCEQLINLWKQVCTYMHAHAHN